MRDAKLLIKQIYRFYRYEFNIFINSMYQKVFKGRTYARGTYVLTNMEFIVHSYKSYTKNYI